MIKILIIEDDYSMANFLRVLFSAQDYEVFEAKSAKLGITFALSYNPEIILLDLGLPDMDGIEVIQQIRSHIKSSIIVVSAREKENDKITALDYGADDYLNKPFNTQELLARVRVALRHQMSSEENVDKIIKIHDLTLDIDKHSLYRKEVKIHLTPIEFSVLAELMMHPGRVLTHSYFVKKIWGEGNMESDTLTLRVTMANLRRKIETSSSKPDYIFTEIGIGYRFRDQ